MKNFISYLSRKVNYPFLPPEVMQVSLTYRCNLRCKMCSIAGLLPADEELSTRQVFHIIDETKDYGIKQLLLTGGEPFLREDIFEICKYAHDKGLVIVITTNGVLINSGISEAVVDSQVNHLHFSLDGLESTNDFFRGPGTFNRIIAAINILNEKRREKPSFSIGIACTVMDENVKELFEIYKLADDLGVDVINFQPLVKDNKNFLDKNTPEFWVKKQNLPVLKEMVLKMRAYKPRHISIHEEPRIELLPGYYEGRLTRKDWVCFGGFKTAFICFSKNEPLVYSCHGICGNLDKVHLKKAWTSKEAFKLRLHSGSCRDLCMQSCYSEESAQHLGNLIMPYFGKKK